MPAGLEERGGRVLELGGLARDVGELDRGLFGACHISTL